MRRNQKRALWSRRIECRRSVSFNIHPLRRDVDELLWVVVGDIPPAYLVTDDAPDPVAALQAYIREMRRWIEAVRLGRPIADLIPVNALPTAVNATTSRFGSTSWKGTFWSGIAKNRERVSSMKIWRLIDPNDDRYARASRRGTWSPGKGLCPECKASREERDLAACHRVGAWLGGNRGFYLARPGRCRGHETRLGDPHGAG